MARSVSLNEPLYSRADPPKCEKITGDKNHRSHNSKISSDLKKVAMHPACAIPTTSERSFKGLLCCSKRAIHPILSTMIYGRALQNSYGGNHPLVGSRNVLIAYSCH